MKRRSFIAGMLAAPIAAQLPPIFPHMPAAPSVVLADNPGLITFISPAMYRALVEVGHPMLNMFPVEPLPDA